MSEQRRKNLYWASTSLLAIGMLGAGVQEVRQAPEILEAAHRLGYPEYVLTLLGLAKLIGAPLLLIQGFPHLKEWVYAGFSFDFDSGRGHVLPSPTCHFLGRAPSSLLLLLSLSRFIGEKPGRRLTID